jgi:NADH dehydrogenase FAD-containing subunit
MTLDDDVIVRLDHQHIVYFSYILSSKMKVAVIGGGIAGIATCKRLRKLDKNVEIILIEPKDYVEVHWCGVRSLFDGEVARDATFSIHKWAIGKSITHVKGWVTEVTDTEVLLSDGQYIEFTICVICTGATTLFPGFGRGPPNPKGKGQRKRPGALSYRLGQMDHWGKKLLNAESVAIIGGGLIGIELAGELAFRAKQQSGKLRVTLIHNEERLVPEFTRGAADMTHEKLLDMGVEIILNEKAVLHKDGNVQLSNCGEWLVTDEIVWTTGNKPINTFLDENFLDRQGWITVDEHFRVKGGEGRFFAMGDCCDLLPNTGSQAIAASYVLAKNIKTTLDHMMREDYKIIEQRLKKALIATEMYVATLGRTDGVALTPICHTQFFLPFLKNQTFFLYQVKSKLGLTE